jgi:Uma2 family endonuclease
MQKTFTMRDVTPLVTAEELPAIVARDDDRYELVAGRVIRTSPVGWQHGVIVVRLLGLLDGHVRSRRLGAVVTEVGFKLRSNPDTVRGPDVAFIRQDRLPAQKLRGYWSGAPDLAMEVLSPGDTSRDIDATVADYLAAGVSEVVVVDPDEATVTQHRPGQAPQVARPGGALDLDDVVPGFRCAVNDILE